MNIKLFYHSLYSDWNHGNAHFLRGVVKELMRRGHRVEVFEPVDGWSLNNLLKDHGREKLEEFSAYYPGLKSRFYDKSKADFEALVEGADLVIVHEWNDTEVVTAIGKAKERLGFKLLFHDTHHRAVSAPASLDSFDFEPFDGALVFGDVLRDIYRENRWLDRVWTWHEAADTTLFKPLPKVGEAGDLVWIGNWGDDERSGELDEFLIQPVRELGLTAKVYGVRYPQKALDKLREAGIEYGGWLPNYKVPQVLARYRFTIHVPRRQYARDLPGIPTIRPFEVMACGIPLISAPWHDVEHLFERGKDYLMVQNGEEMKRTIKQVLADEQLHARLSRCGRHTIVKHHSCARRVDELMEIYGELSNEPIGSMEEEIVELDKKHTS